MTVAGKPQKPLASRLKETLPYGVRREVKVRRALIAESLGSKRFSRAGLYELDRELAPYLNFCDGVFLEIGANDGYSQSNTYYLERWLGWSGILIEPLPDLFAYCRRIRPHSSCYNLACTASTAERFLSIEPSNLTTTVTRHMDSRTMGALRVTTAMLSEVIDDAGLGAPDFISIDVEGFELDVLHGLRLEDHTPLFMLVETDDPKGVERLLGTSMRFEAQLTYHDYLFRRVAS